MLISIEFPFVDVRGFLEEDVGRLPVPNWPGAIPNEDFVRCFGIVRNRPRGGLPGWILENSICEARRALVFKRRPGYHDGRSGTKVRFGIAYRRLYFNGLAVGKYSLGLGTSAFRDTILSSRASEEMFFQALRLPVTIRNEQGERIEQPLWAAGKYLIDLYARSTLKSEFTSRQEAWWVKRIAPILFLMQYTDEKLHITFPGCQLPGGKCKDFVLARHTIRIEGMDLPLWVMRLEDASFDFSLVRDLRIAISRLYAEYNALLYVLRCISKKDIIVTPNSDASRNLQNYIRNAINVLSRKEARIEELCESEGVEIARYWMYVADRAQADVLIETLRNVGSGVDALGIDFNIRNKVQKFCENMIFNIERLEVWQNMTVFDQRNQTVQYQYNSAGSINFGNLSQPHDLVVQLEKVQHELNLAREAKVITEDLHTDAEYQIKKAISQAKQPAPNKKSLLGYIETAKDLVSGVSSLGGLAVDLAAAVQKIGALLT